MNENNEKNDYRVVKGFISNEERELLLEKADYHFSRKEYRVNPAGPHRFVTRLDKEPQLDDLVKKMTDRVIETFGLHNYEQEPVLNKLISRIEPGGFIQKHIDTLSALEQYAKYQKRVVNMPTNCENFRCNIMVKMDNESAFPLIGEDTVEISECDSWGFLPSTIAHGTQLITGGTRIIFGFGFLVPKDFKL